MLRKQRLRILTLAMAAALSGAPPKCDPACRPLFQVPPVTVQHIKVHGSALEGNLEGDAVDHDVFVFAAQLQQRSASWMP